MAFVTNRPIIIPAGSEVRLATSDGAECYEIMQTEGCMRIFIGRQAARDQGFISPASKGPNLFAVQSGYSPEHIDA